MRAPVRDALARGPLILCDSATGTMLSVARLPAGRMPETWGLISLFTVHDV